MNKTMLRKYAKLIVKVGVNVKKGQGCIIVCPVEQHEFAKIVTEEAYRAGAKWVRIDWEYQDAVNLKYRHETVKTLSEVTTWEEEKAKYTADALPALIRIEAEDPDGLKGVNTEKMQKALVARQSILKKYRDAWDNKLQWTIVAVPCVKWAKKIFPGERAGAAVEKLWNAIFDTVRITKDNDPVAEWKAHNDELREKYEKLNAYNFEKLHYSSKNGTDFTCWLIPDSKWMGGSDKLSDGTEYNPNMPTEEVFISPMAGKAEGTVHSTKPLSYQGQLIDNFSITFENGRAVSWDAETGLDALSMMIGMDEGAKKIGELALIPYNSPISNSGILFYNTLFDENASCHIALGKGFSTSINGGENMSAQELKEAGINDSMIHVDFMIGSEDMNIDGYTRDGKIIPVFRNGNWAI